MIIYLMKLIILMKMVKKLDDIYNLIVSNKDPGNKKYKTIYNKMLKFYTLKRDLTRDYAKSLDISLSDSDSDQTGSGIKGYTPSQLITRLPILIGQLKAGNSSIDLTNEIRQTIYSLYRNNMINIYIII